MMRSISLVAVRLALFFTCLGFAGHGFAQSFKRAGTEFNAVRSVSVPSGKPYTIIVTEFLHQGEVQPDGKNVIVLDGNKKPVPMRILQIGPGDFCRLAFQTVPGQSEYDIFYGGDPPTEKSPPWTCRDGLLFETRQFSPCDMQSLESVREAFEKAAPIGADYVDSVFHNANPFTLTRGPFLSRYSGQMDIRKPGTYGFMVSSQDCSFLLIDGKLVVSSPGHHGPVRHAFRGSRQDVKLSAGEHSFDYYHAAAGQDAVMVAAWEIDPTDPKPQRPEAIPPEVFHTHLVAHLPATRLSLRTAKQAPDFVVKLINDVPLPDNEVPLIGALFRNVSVKALTMQGAKLQWDFGDGQTSDLPSADHVYLRPGLYTVKLSIRRGSKTIEAVNRIQVDRPHLNPKDKLHTFDAYLRIIETYDPKTLDAPSLLQMVRALEAKSLALANKAEDVAAKAKTAEDDPNRRPDARKESRPKAETSEDVLADVSKAYLAKAVAAGQVAFTGDSAAKGDEELLELARLIGPMARLQLGDSPTAFAIWRGAAERVGAPEIKAECEIAAADIAINDLLKPAEAKTLLDAAAERLGKGQISPIAASLQRVWGDYYAATGDGKAANDAYAEAERVGGFSRPFIEITAIRGAYCRSTEDFIKDKQYSRAAEEIQAWRENFPTANVEGYLSLLLARYWAGREKYAQAIAQAERLQAINPDSSYIDQLLLLAADCELRAGRKDRALATLHSILKDYPGSPLAPLVRKNIEALEKQEKK